MVGGDLLTHDDDLVPLGAVPIRRCHLDALRSVDECVAVTPHEVNLAELGQQVDAFGVGFERAIDQVGGLVVQAVGHVEICLGDRIALIEVDGGLAAEGVFERPELPGSSRLRGEIIGGSRRIECVFVQRQDSGFLFDDDDRLVRWRRPERFSGRHSRIVEIGCFSPGAGPGLQLVVIIAAAAHEPEQHAGCKDDRSADDRPDTRQRIDNPVDQRRFGARRRGDDSGWWLDRRIRVRIHGICVVRRNLVRIHEQFIIGRCIVRVVSQHVGIVDRRLVNLAADVRQFLPQCCQFVIADFDQRPLLRYVGRLEFGDPIEDLLLARHRLTVGGTFGTGTDADRFFVRRNECQARARCRRDRIHGGRRHAGPCRMLPPRFVKRIAAIDTIDVVCIRNRQTCPGMQEIDIAAEAVGVGLVDGKHRLIHRQTSVGTEARGDAPECLASMHNVVAACQPVVLVRFIRSTCLRLRLRALRWCRYRPRLPLGLTRRWLRLRLRLRLPFDARAVGRRTTLWRRYRRLRLCCSKWCKRRRVEKHGVFTQQTTSCPCRFDEKCQKRLGDRRGGSNTDVIALCRPGANDFEVDVLQIVRPVEAIALEGLLRGHCHEQVVEFFGHGREQFDLSPQGRVKR